jgi:hypothetical protein
MVVGFKGKAGAGRLCALPYGDTAIVWRRLRPCLNPLGSTGKRPVGPEHSGAALRPFNLLIPAGPAGRGLLDLLLFAFWLYRAEKQERNRTMG